MDRFQVMCDVFLHSQIDDLDMTVLELKKILSAKHNIPAHLINISLGGILFQGMQEMTLTFQ